MSKACMHCNVQLPEGSQFCPSCGRTQIPEESTQSVNTNYGSSYPYGSYAQSTPPPPPMPKGDPIVPPTPPKKKKFNIKRKIVVIPAIILAILSLLIGGAVYGSWSQSLYYSQHQPTATQQNSNPVNSGNFDFADSLVSQNQNQWDENTSNAADYFCTFKDNAYHVVSIGDKYTTPCLTRAASYKNFFMKVDMTIIKAGTGDYHGGGLVFRATSDDSDGYRFYIDNTSANALYKTKNITSTTSVKAMLNQKYRIAAFAYNNTMSFYVDGALVLTITDSTYNKEGFIGFIGGQSEVSFSNLKVVTL